MSWPRDLDLPRCHPNRGRSNSESGPTAARRQRGPRQSGAAAGARDARRTATSRRPRARAPLARSTTECELVGRFAVAVERGDTEAVGSLLTDEAWLTMPPEPGEYQGGEAIARFLRDCEARRGTSCGSCRRGRTGQPAFGCYLPDLQAAIARAYGLMVLTLTADRISAITLMRERSLLPHFGLPQRFPRRRRVIAAEGGARPLYVGGWASAGEESVRLQRLPVHFVRRRCLNEYLENDHQDDAWKRAATR